MEGGKEEKESKKERREGKENRPGLIFLSCLCPASLQLVLICGNVYFGSRALCLPVNSHHLGYVIGMGAGMLMLLLHTVKTDC